MWESNLQQGGNGFGKSTVDRQVAEQIQPADRRSLQVDNKPILLQEFFQPGDGLPHFSERERLRVATPCITEKKSLRGKTDRQIPIRIAAHPVMRCAENAHSRLVSRPPVESFSLFWPPSGRTDMDCVDTYCWMTGLQERTLPATLCREGTDLVGPKQGYRENSGELSGITPFDGYHLKKSLLLPAPGRRSA